MEIREAINRAFLVAFLVISFALRKMYRQTTMGWSISTLVDIAVTQYYVYLRSSFCAFVIEKLLQGAEGIPIRLVRFFTNFPQYKNANIANFVLAVSLERNWTIEVCNLEM